jgi:hypothetical protein
MSYPFMLNGDEIEDGKAFRGGEGRSGAVYSGIGRRLPEKRVYVSPELASPFEKSGRVVLQRWVSLRILRINIKPLIRSARQKAGRRGELGGGVVDSVFGGLLWHDRFRWEPGLHFP